VEVVDGVAEEYLAAATKALDGDPFAEFERNVRAFYSQMAVIKIRPRRARYYDFGAGLMPRFLLELACKFLLELAGHASTANESTPAA
jgi:hypothetical protein